jgi:hypothetical protein
MCDEYMQQAYRTAKEEIGNTGSKMAEHARAACISDVILSGTHLVSLFISTYSQLIILHSGDKVLSDMWLWML